MNTDMIKLFIHKLANIPSGIANAAQQGGKLAHAVDQEGQSP
jgi:hypothetical protein